MSLTNSAKFAFGSQRLVLRGKMISIRQTKPLPSKLYNGTTIESGNRSKAVKLMRTSGIDQNVAKMKW